MKELSLRQVTLKDHRLLSRENDNRSYLMELTNRNLLYNYELEATLVTDAHIPGDIHGGWESPTCQLRGHFLGHWLSAAAMHIAETGDRELKAKADVIVDELRRCQIHNGGRWAASIPEKYLHNIAQGKGIWAPHYTIHKTFMGLVDMYKFTGNETALKVADDFADWFVEWTEQFDRKQLDDILDYETGGMLEIWANLYEITGNDKYKTLMERYYRGRLFAPLIAGADPLTNMHANTTIPEVIAAAKIYDITGDEHYRKIAENYWNQAVTERGMYATGGQTNGEIWGPKMSLSARMGHKTQEHCTVYNMMRLADFLFRWTGKAEYADYIERNLFNGVMAQTYWHWEHTNGYEADSPKEGLIAYFLPMRAGAHKGWGSKTNDFFCCHGTMVQANAALNRYIYYLNNTNGKDDNNKDGSSKHELYVAQYFDSDAKFDINGKTVRLIQRRDPLTGSFHLSSTSNGKQTVNRTAAEYPHDPDTLQVYLQIECDEPVDLSIKVRIPWWITAPATVEYNNTLVATADPTISSFNSKGQDNDNGNASGSFITVGRTFSNGDVICVTMKKGITTYPLPDDSDTVAFLYGPEVLAGLVDEERIIYTGGKDPAELIVHENEREWGSWKSDFKITGQPRGIRFIPLNRIGYENYSIYFPITGSAIS